MPKQVKDNNVGEVKIAQLSMDYSNTAKKVYINVILGDEPEDDRNAQGLMEHFESEGFIVSQEPVIQNGATVGVKKGSFRIIMDVIKKSKNSDSEDDDDDGDNNWSTFNKYERDIIDDIYCSLNYKGGGDEDDDLRLKNCHYKVSTEDKTYFESMPSVINATLDVLSEENASNLYNAVPDFVEKLFKNINSPKIQKMLGGICVINANRSPEEGVEDIGDMEFGSPKFVLATKAFTPRNTLWMIAQWFNYGLTGTPTVVATPKQWRSVGRVVSGGTHPLVASRPYRYNGDEMGESEAERRLGMSANDADQKGFNVKRAFDRYASFQNDYRVNDFTGVVYYDVIHTKIVDAALWNKFISDANMENISHKFNQKAIDMMSDKEKVNYDNKIDGNDKESDESEDEELPQYLDNNVINEKLTRKAIIELISGKNEYSETAEIVESGEIYSVLWSYFSHNVNIDREHDEFVKRLKIKMCVFATLHALELSLVDMKRIWRDVNRYFADINELVQISQNVSPIVNSVRRMQKQYIDGNLTLEGIMINEIKKYTFQEFLSSFGLTLQDAKKQCKMNAERENNFQMEGRQMKSSFVNMWNRIINANNLNHGEII